MADAAGAAHRLFGLPSVVAAAQALPFAAGAFDAAWCLGVLCTTAEKAAALAELRRVLVGGGRLGLLVYLADRPPTLPVPEGNSFPSERETRELLASAGFTLEATAEADLGDSPPEWQERADAVEDVVAAAHRDDERFREAQRQSGRVGRLLAAGQLRAWLGVAVRDTGVP
jgi:SAM-dependent methyltransferase